MIKLPECIQISNMRSPTSRVIHLKDAFSQINAKIIIVKKRHDVKISGDICPTNQETEVIIPIKQSHSKEIRIDKLGSKVAANLSSKKITRAA